MLYVATSDSRRFSNGVSPTVEDSRRCIAHARSSDGHIAVIDQALIGRHGPELLW